MAVYEIEAELRCKTSGDYDNWLTEQLAFEEHLKKIGAEITKAEDILNYWHPQRITATNEALAKIGTEKFAGTEEELTEAFDRASGLFYQIDSAALLRREGRAVTLGISALWFAKGSVSLMTEEFGFNTAADVDEYRGVDYTGLFEHEFGRFSDDELPSPQDNAIIRVERDAQQSTDGFIPVRAYLPTGSDAIQWDAFKTQELAKQLVLGTITTVWPQPTVRPQH